MQMNWVPSLKHGGCVTNIINYMQLSKNRLAKHFIFLKSFLLLLLLQYYYRYSYSFIERSSYDLYRWTFPWTIVALNLFSFVLLIVISCVSCCGACCNTPSTAVSKRANGKVLYNNILLICLNITRQKEIELKKVFLCRYITLKFFAKSRLNVLILLRQKFKSFHSRFQLALLNC